MVGVSSGAPQSLGSPVDVKLGGTIHGRSIVTKTGWRINLDRGLDVFQFISNDAFDLAVKLQAYRQVKAFGVTYYIRETAGDQISVGLFPAAVRSATADLGSARRAPTGPSLASPRPVVLRGSWGHCNGPKNRSVCSRRSSINRVLFQGQRIAVWGVDTRASGRVSINSARVVFPRAFCCLRSSLAAVMRWTRSIESAPSCHCA